MGECDTCHRTGFTDDELEAHEGGEFCSTPLTFRDRAEHTEFTVKWRGPKVDVSPGNVPALMDAIENQKGEIASLKAQLAEITKFLATNPSATPAKQPAPTPGKPAGGS